MLLMLVFGLGTLYYQIELNKVCEEFPRDSRFHCTSNLPAKNPWAAPLLMFFWRAHKQDQIPHLSPRIVGRQRQRIISRNPLETQGPGVVIF
jgi:hypothetical protein